jgi:hypothetical protein
MANAIPIRATVFLLAAGLFCTIFRADLTQWEWSGGGFVLVGPQASIPAVPLREAELNSDGIDEQVVIRSGRVQIRHGQEILWSSSNEWQVRQAQITDLDRDGRPELTLLVWRPFAPWPIDAFLPDGGRIAGFHDAQNQSCHIILIQWKQGAFRELWAGSALAEPILNFYAADWNGDGGQELMAVETGYDQPTKAKALSLWEWNGFGFSLIGRLRIGIGKYAFLTGTDDRPSILVDQTN